MQKPCNTLRVGRRMTQRLCLQWVSGLSPHACYAATPLPIADLNGGALWLTQFQQFAFCP